VFAASFVVVNLETRYMSAWIIPSAAIASIITMLIGVDLASHHRSLKTTRQINADRINIESCINTDIIDIIKK